MGISITDIEVLMDAALVALDAGDYDTAIRKAIAAQGRLALVPDMERSGGSGGGGGGLNKMNWTRQSLSDFIINIRRQKNASGGIRVLNVTNNQPEELGEGSHSSINLGTF